MEKREQLKKYSRSRHDGLGWRVRDQEELRDLSEGLDIATPLGRIKSA